MAQQASDADLIVVNTCAVTQEAVRKSRQLIRKNHKENPQAKLVVTGCYSSLSPEEAETQLGADLVVANTSKHELVKIAHDKLDLHAMPQIAQAPGEAAVFARGRSRAFIKVQDGCRYRCTFCIVTVARGEERSRATKEIIDEINSLSLQGVNEVVLAGVHLGGYGSDKDTNLKNLVEAVLSDTDVSRVRLGSLEPWDLPEGFWPLFENPRLMPHLHLPLQSGCDSVLKRMARRCKTDEFEQLVADARHSIPGFNVTTDIIVGFPGETEDEWATSLNTIERIGFGHIHIFSYSTREGTKAARLPGQLPGDIKKARSQQLHALANQLQHDFYRQQLGQTQPVLIENRQEVEGDKIKLFGYTPNYVKVGIQLDRNAAIDHSVVPVQLSHKSEQMDFVEGMLPGDITQFND